MRTGTGLILIGCIVLTGCATAPPPEARFPLKIGLLADSQITSQNGHSNFHYRSKTADTLVEVSIRPPALECVLAEEMLEVALQRLREDVGGDRTGVDLILYLGDAANSGGEDEVDTVLRVLDAHRRRTGTPIYIIIGNHDYLGAGNIVSTGIRFAMLNRVDRPENPPLTKYEVLRRFSDFNRANESLPASAGFRYVDNREALERHRDLDHDSGLYLCGRLSYTAPGRPPVDIFLLDSSDYTDAPDWSEVADLGFYGVIGSVSFKDEADRESQLGWAEAHARSSPPRYRILASHYPKDHLDRITFAKPGEVPLNLTNLMWDVSEGVVSLATFSEMLNQNLDALIVPGHYNYWVSGHTHVPTMPKPQRFSVGGLIGERYFTSINVGSTTDYRAHVAIIERCIPTRNVRVDGALGYREIPLYQGDAALLLELVRSIGAYARTHAGGPHFQPVIQSEDDWIAAARRAEQFDLGALLGQRRDGLRIEERYWIHAGAAMLGLGKCYREAAWNDAQTEAAALNLRTFITDFIERTGANRRDVIAGLGLLAGACEREMITDTFDFSSKALRGLIDAPR